MRLLDDPCAKSDERACGRAIVRNLVTNLSDRILPTSAKAVVARAQRFITALQLVACDSCGNVITEQGPVSQDFMEVQTGPGFTTAPVVAYIAQVEKAAATTTNPLKRIQVRNNQHTAGSHVRSVGNFYVTSDSFFEHVVDTSAAKAQKDADKGAAAASAARDRIKRAAENSAESSAYLVENLTSSQTPAALASAAQGTSRKIIEHIKRVTKIHDQDKFKKAAALLQLKGAEFLAAYRVFLPSFSYSQDA